MFILLELFNNDFKKLYNLKGTKGGLNIAPKKLLLLPNTDPTISKKSQVAGKLPKKCRPK